MAVWEDKTFNVFSVTGHNHELGILNIEKVWHNNIYILVFWTSKYLLYNAFCANLLFHINLFIIGIFLSIGFIRGNHKI